MDTNMPVFKSSSLDNIPDLPSGKQHWSLSGTPFERERESESTEWTPNACKLLISSDPEKAFRLWRDRYRTHVSCAIDYPLWTWTQAFATEFMAGNILAGALPELVSLGWCDFFMEVVCRDDSFDDAPVLVARVFELMNCTIGCVIWRTARGLEDSRMKDAINGMVTTACRVSWQHRKRFLSRNSPETGAAGSMHTVQHQLHRMLVTYNSYHISNEEHYASGCVALMHTGYEDVRRMTMFMWFYHHDLWKDRSPGCAPLKGEDFLFYVLATLENVPDESPEIVNFAQSEVLSEYGALPFLKRLSLSLRLPTLDDQDLMSFEGVIQRVLLRTEFLPHFYSSGVLESLRAAGIHRLQEAEDAPQCLAITMGALDIYRGIATRVPVPDGRALLVRHCDVVGLLSQTLIYSAQIGYTFADRCCKHVDDYTAFSRVLCERHGKKNALRKSLTQAVRYHWYDTLQRLRSLRVVHRNLPRARPLLIERSWLAFGNALGLDEEQEAREHEREKKRVAQFCTRKDCQYHQVKPPSPTTACKGCGEVRYCGKMCQTKDWKDGHKQVCKRIKNEAHAPKK